MSITLYSQYFNPKLSRSMGRRIPLDPAKKYSDESLVNILKGFGFKYEVRDARYPRVPWESCKMYVLEANVKKSTLIKMIERKLR
ncbi:MAG: signal recognition particle [Candidatus Thermoplasmatota archaeon]|nr:signal recognition particle [Candidatus Thermoplasmatota archaeon]